MYYKLPEIFPEISALKSHISKAERNLEKKLVDWRETRIPKKGTSDVLDEDIVGVFSEPIIKPYRNLIEKYRREKISESEKRHYGWPEEHVTRVGEILAASGFNDEIVLAGLYHCYINDFSKETCNIGNLINEIKKQTKSDAVVNAALQHTNKYRLIFKAISQYDQDNVKVGDLRKRIKYLEKRLRNKSQLKFYGNDLKKIKEYLESKEKREEISIKSIENEFFQEQLIKDLEVSENDNHFYSVFLANILDEMSVSEDLSTERFLELTTRSVIFLENRVEDKKVNYLKTRLAYRTMEKIYHRMKALEREKEYLFKVPDGMRQLINNFRELKQNFSESIISFMKREELYSIFSIRYNCGDEGIADFFKKFGTEFEGGTFSYQKEKKGKPSKIEVKNIVLGGITPEELERKVNMYFRNGIKHEIKGIL